MQRLIESGAYFSSALIGEETLHRASSQGVGELGGRPIRKLMTYKIRGKLRHPRVKILATRLHTSTPIYYRSKYRLPRVLLSITDFITIGKISNEGNPFIIADI